MSKSKREMIPKTIKDEIIRFLGSCRMDENGKFSSTPGGPETLYASCFACMTMHYLGVLNSLSSKKKRIWGDYINSWQDPKTGYFIGPEVVREELTSPNHTYDHIIEHLTCHVLPALSLLEQRTKYPLAGAKKYTDIQILKSTLNKIDWKDAWLEGNNLLFIGQFLVFIRDSEKDVNAQPALDFYFDWLDDQIDPLSGLWGTNGYCDSAAALYGGYHQLLVYYYESRPVLYPNSLIDTALSLQHYDGGFNLQGGGGACEDVDAIDILVNLYKLTPNFKRSEIRVSLRRALNHILKMQMSDGGFAYRLNEPFMHMGIQKTITKANCSNLFSTWFRLHTIALISEILTDDRRIKHAWQFNTTCSMGWHRPWHKKNHGINLKDKVIELFICLRINSTNKQRIKHLFKKYLPWKIVKIMEKMNKR